MLYFVAQLAVVLRTFPVNMTMQKNNKKNYAGRLGIVRFVIYLGRRIMQELGGGVGTLEVS